MQFTIKNAQLNDRLQGAVEIVSDDGIFIVLSRYAKQLRKAYAEQLNHGAAKWDLHIQFNIEIAEPISNVVELADPDQRQREPSN